MHADNRRVDHVDRSLMRSGQCLHDPAPDARPSRVLPAMTFPMSRISPRRPTIWWRRAGYGAPPGCRCFARRSPTHSSNLPLASSTMPCSAALRIIISNGVPRGGTPSPGKSSSPYALLQTISRNSCHRDDEPAAGRSERAKQSPWRGPLLVRAALRPVHAASEWSAIGISARPFVMRARQQKPPQEPPS
jgi:hypothetical protein